MVKFRIFPWFSLIVVLGFLPFSGRTQGTSSRTTLKYFNKTEIGTAMGIGTFKGDIDSGSVQRKLNNDQLIFPIQTINGFTFSDKLGIGLGLGIEFWDEGLFYPVFGHVFYDLKSDGNTFFGSMNIGKAFGKRYATSYYAEGNGGLLFSIGIGYKMTVWKRLKFLYELFYRYQSIESYYTVYYDSDRTKSSQVDEKFPYNFIGLRIGIFFR